MVSVPTHGEAFSKLLHHWDEASNQVAMLAHLTRAQSNLGKDRAMADGWLAMGELMRRARWQMTELAKGHIQ